MVAHGRDEASVPDSPPLHETPPFAPPEGVRPCRCRWRTRATAERITSSRPPIGPSTPSKAEVKPPPPLPSRPLPARHGPVHVPPGGLAAAAPHLRVGRLPLLRSRSRVSLQRRARVEHPGSPSPSVTPSPPPIPSPSATPSPSTAPSPSATPPPSAVDYSAPSATPPPSAAGTPPAWWPRSLDHAGHDPPAA